LKVNIPGDQIVTHPKKISYIGLPLKNQGYKGTEDRMNSETEISDDALISGIREGNRQLIQTLYTANYPMIRKLVIDNSGSEAEAKDVFQEAIIVFYENIRTKGFNLTCKINTYIYSVSRNIWLKQLKRKMPQIKDLNDHKQIIDISRDFGKHEERQNRLDKLNNALEEIGEPCNSILTYFFFNRLTMEEIAGKMGYTNAANAKNQKYKCFKRLKKIVLKAI
jgi:RNA polymerase sigma factor (sigma-70 family)